MAPTRCALCRLYDIRRPKNNKRKANEDIRFLRRNHRGWIESVLKDIKDDPVHFNCVRGIIKDVEKLNKMDDWENIPIPKNPILEDDDESDESWTDEEIWITSPYSIASNPRARPSSFRVL